MSPHPPQLPGQSQGEPGDSGELATDGLGHRNIQAWLPHIAACPQGCHMAEVLLITDSQGSQGLKELKPLTGARRREKEEIIASPRAAWAVVIPQRG